MIQAFFIIAVTALYVGIAVLYTAIAAAALSIWKGVKEDRR